MVVGTGEKCGVVVVMVAGVGKEWAEGGGANVGGELLFSIVEVVLDLLELVLEEGDVANTAINGVAQPRLGFVSKGIDGIFSLRRRELVQELGDVARSEDPVHVGELLRLVRWEVGRKDASLRALAPQELARRARRVRRRHRLPSSTSKSFPK